MDHIVEKKEGQPPKRYRRIRKLKEYPVFLTNEEIQEIEETFRLFDADKSNNIDLNELQVAM